MMGSKKFFDSIIRYSVNFFDGTCRGEYSPCADKSTPTRLTWESQHFRHTQCFVR